MQNGDIESVLFLLTVQVNVNTRVQDATQLTPLHICVQTGNEIILRNLVRSFLHDREAFEPSCDDVVTGWSEYQ